MLTGFCSRGTIFINKLYEMGKFENARALEIHNLPPNNYDTLLSLRDTKPSLFDFYVVNRNTTLKVPALKKVKTP